MLRSTSAHVMEKPESPKSGSQNGRRGWQRYALPALAVVVFIALAVAVFLVANDKARTMSAGLPNFNDSPFALTDQTGTSRRNDDFAGKPIALFFGFTYCPDVCPTTLMSLANALDELATDGVDTSRLEILFITVDFERDTPEQLANYLSLFDMRVTGLTGDVDSLADARKAFGAFAQRVVNDDGDVTYDHSAALYLYRPDGTFAGTIVFNEPHEFMLEKLRRLLG